MALTKGKIKINNIEYDVKSCKVEKVQVVHALVEQRGQYFIFFHKECGLGHYR